MGRKELCVSVQQWIVEWTFSTSPASKAHSAGSCNIFVLVGNFINKHFYYPVCSLSVKHQALSLTLGLIAFFGFNAFLSF